MAIGRYVRSLTQEVEADLLDLFLTTTAVAHLLPHEQTIVCILFHVVAAELALSHLLECEYLNIWQIVSLVGVVSL